MVNIKKQIVSASVASKVTYNGVNPVNYITVHQTGNTNRGADAYTHAKLQSNGNSRSASWHYTVDDKEVWQSFEDTAQCWAGGDGNGPGNTQSVHVEICINSDGDYKKSVKNGAELVKYLMDKHNLSISKVKQHYDWSRKNCPAQIRANKDGISWSDFKNMVNGKKVSSAPKEQVKSSTVKTDSIVDWMNANKMNSSYSNRAKLAKQYGISGYKGTASQNEALLKKLKGGSPSKPKSSSKLPNAVYRANKPYPNGSGVRTVQEALASVYFYPNKGAKNNGIDGYYGPNTANAVKRFQSMYGLTADGVYGPATRSKLLKVMK